MEAKNIAIKNITTNEIFVGTQLEWNILLSPGYILDSPEMVLQEMKSQHTESEFEIIDVQIRTVRSIFNSSIK